MSERRAGLLMILLAATGYAFLPVFTRKIYELSTLQPVDIALWRFAFATPAIWLMIQWRKPAIDRTLDRKKLLGLGIVYSGATLTGFFGLQRIEASTYIVLFYTYPAMVTLISFVGGTRLSRMAWLALGMTLIGIILTVPDFSLSNGNDAIGIGLALLNALVVAVYFLLVGRVMGKTDAVARGSAWVITGTLLTLLLLLPIFGLQVPASGNTWLLLLGLGTISTALPIFAMNTGIRKIGATQASIISTVEPVESMLLAVILLGEVVLPVQWLGAALIILAVLLLELRPRRKAHPPEQQNLNEK
jgi:drug/metabolite transporter (DMT)-like permease